MAKIVRVQFADVVSQLEPVTLFDPQSLGTSPPEDLFLCALGFEPRSLTLPRRLKEAGYTVRRAAYFTYSTNLDDNVANLRELDAHLRAVATSVEPIEADAPDFPSRLRALIQLVLSEATRQPPRVTLDISVTANRLLLRCLQVFLECGISARIIYSEAGTYHPTEEEYRADPSKWETDDILGLERGVGDVMPSIDHPGHSLDPLPDSLVLFPSFKAERSKAVISFVDPSLLTNAGGKVIWLLGVPHLEADRWRVDAMKRINGIGPDAPQYEVSTFDYKDTLRVLEHLHSEMSDRYTITLSPLGSKMQALGTALFCYLHPDVRIIFSVPKEYNAAQYSKGCKELWTIDLGDLQALRRKLDALGTLRVDD